MANTSNFDEKSGVVVCNTPWGRWWQTVEEVNVEVDLPVGTRAREIQVDIKPSCIKCVVRGEVIFEGKLCRSVVVGESTWTVSEQKLLWIQMVKADPICSEKMWNSLLEYQYYPDPITFNEMQKKLDLERFQIENPGFNFSSAKLSKSYGEVLPTDYDREATK